MPARRWRTGRRISGSPSISRRRSFTTRAFFRRSCRRWPTPRSPLTGYEIEITESMLLSKYGSAASILNALLELGATVALDDFGTGFSSLTYLRKLPFSRIKIDQSFIRDMLVQPDCAAIVKSVVGLAQELRMGVVAEGVETAGQLEFLRQANCDEAQGWLIGRPVLAVQIAGLLHPQSRRSDHAA